MSIGEINKGAIALILVMLLGAGGYLWHTQMYKPAVELKTAAAVEEQTAQDGLATAKSKLAAAQQAIEEAKKQDAKPDPSVAQLQLATKAVPRKKLIDDAAIVLMDLARRADVRTSFKSSGNDAATSAPEPSGNLNGAIPIDLQFKAAGSYAEMMLFMRLVEDTVVEEDGKLYARDRLFNVVKLQIGGDNKEDSLPSGFSGEDNGDNTKDANELVARPGEILFTVTVRMYTSSTGNAQSVGAATDPAAAATTSPDAADGATSGTNPTGGTAPAGSGAAGTAPAGTAAGGGAAAPASDSTAAGSAPATGTGAAVPAAGGNPG